MVDTVYLNEATSPENTNIVLTAADGTASHQAASVMIYSGNGGPALGGHNGAPIQLHSGAADSSGGSGGSIQMFAGPSAGIFAAGDIGLTTGTAAGSGRGGHFNFTAGDGGASGGNGGSMNIFTGTGNSNANGGDINFYPGGGNGAGRNGLFFPNLPTGDPGVSGAAYIDGSGFVKISP